MPFFVKQRLAIIYSDLIDKCSGNSKKLFRVINSLSKQKSSESLPPYEDPLILANEFGTFFGRKIELINDEINKIGVNPITTEHRLPEVLLKSFSPVSQDDIRGVISKASNASCESCQLDPIPTYLLKGDLQSVCKQSLCLHFCVQNIELYSTTIYIFQLLEYNK